MTMILEIEAVQFNKDAFIQDVKNKVSNPGGNTIILGSVYVMQPYDDKVSGLISTPLGLITFRKRSKAWVIKLYGDAHDIHALLGLIHDYISDVLEFYVDDTSTCECG